MRAYAVIGANYGDEGKGRTVDWLAASLGPDVVVVRSNGGAQAGHTVVTGGRPHVFHHFGSATLRQGRTHLSRFMVSHPILFADEWETLIGFGDPPRVTADPRGWVTTPWDMMVNQAVELARGGHRHGSCGLGFGETVGRSEQTSFAVTVADLCRPDLVGKLRAIRNEWLPVRCAQLGIELNSGPLAFAAADALLERFVEQCRAFSERVVLKSDADLPRMGPIIFEAAQGLLLDQGAAGFPFVTRSSTGLANITAIAAEAGLGELEAVYVTRCYLTRHGRGGMEDERSIDQWFSVDDATNLPNPWQETLRFGLLDPARLGRRIAADLAVAGDTMAVTPSLAITCLDQARDDRLGWIDGAEVRSGSVRETMAELEMATRLPWTAEFWAPSNE